MSAQGGAQRQTWVIRDYLLGRDLGTVEAVSERGALSAATRQGMWSAYRSAWPVAPVAAPAEEEAPTPTLSAAQRTPDKYGPYAMSFPVAAPADAHWTDSVVTQGHADYCAAWGHATFTNDGRVDARCPRCGDALEEAQRVAAQGAADALGAELQELEEETPDAEWIDRYAPEEAPQRVAYSTAPTAPMSAVSAAEWRASKLEALGVSREAQAAQRVAWDAHDRAGLELEEEFGTPQPYAPVSAMGFAPSSTIAALYRAEVTVLPEWLNDPVNVGCHKDANSGFWVINTVTELANYSRTIQEA